MSGLQKEELSYRDDWNRLLAEGGWFSLSHWRAVRVHGPDQKDFLHRLTTWDGKKARPDRADRGAILNGRAQPVAMGWFLPGTDETLLVFPEGQAASAAAHLEAMHFAENLAVTLENLPVAAEAKAGLAPPASPGALRRDGAVWRWSDDVQPLDWSVGAPADPRRPLDGRVFEYLRLRDAIPEVGKELAPTGIVLEGNFDRPIARGKGCYPGQEVIERIFTYGQVNRRLYPIAWDAVRDLPPGVPLRATAGGVPEGTVVGSQRNPDGNGGIGLALFPRAAWDYSGSWTAPTEDGEVVVRRRAREAP